MRTSLLACTFALAACNPMSYQPEPQRHSAQEIARACNEAVGAREPRLIYGRAYGSDYGSVPGPIIVGDTKPCVKLQMGEPDSVDSSVSEHGTSEWWYYPAHRAGLAGDYTINSWLTNPTWVHFVDGRVYSVHVDR